MDMAAARSPVNFNSQINFFFPLFLSACEIASAALVLLQAGGAVWPGMKYQARPIL